MEINQKVGLFNFHSLVFCKTIIQSIFSVHFSLLENTCIIITRNSDLIERKTNSDFMVYTFLFQVC